MRSDQRRLYERQWTRRKRADNYLRLNALKLDRGCVDCGYKDHPAALDFDHVDPVKKVSEISKMAGLCWSTIAAELEKCVVRCANCHRIKTFQDRYGGYEPDMEMPAPDYARGERIHRSTLTAQDVMAIRSRRAGGEKITDLAIAFSTTKGNISSIARRKTWRHV